MSFYAALENMQRHKGAKGSNKLFLTFVGGGVFGNEIEWIYEAIDMALEKFKRT